MQGIGLIMPCFLVVYTKTNFSTVMCAMSVSTNAFKESTSVVQTHTMMNAVSVWR